VLTGPDCVLMVDGEFAPLTPKIVAAIRQFSSEPIPREYARSRRSHRRQRKISSKWGSDRRPRAPLTKGYLWGNFAHLFIKQTHSKRLIYGLDSCQGHHKITIKTPCLSLSTAIRAVS
jgi:hypothetical protein